MSEQTQRREIIRRILLKGDIDSQETLRAAARRAGFEVTQATLSRDLAALGARRVTHADGGTSYELETAQPAPVFIARPAMNTLVRDVTSNGALVVVLASTGAASAVAAAIDAARLDDVLGTIAGDDTIFVAPRNAKYANRLATKLGALFGMNAREAT